MSRISTTVSHVVLAGVSAWALVQIPINSFRFVHVTYGVLLTNSILGIITYGSRTHGQRVHRVFRITSFLSTICALPFFVTDYCLQNGVQKEYAYIPAALAAIPFIAWLGSRSSEPKEAEDIIIIVDLAVLGFLAVDHHNYYGIATAVSYAFNHFIIHNEGTFLDLPAQDLYNYGMCFYTVFTVFTLKD